MDIATDAEVNLSVTVKVSQIAQINPNQYTRQFGPYRLYISSVTEQKIKRPTTSSSSSYPLLILKSLN